MNKRILFERLKRELGCSFQYPELDKIIKSSKVYSKRNNEYTYYDNKKKEVNTSFKYEFNESEYQEIKTSAVKYLEQQGKLTYRNELAKELGTFPKRITDYVLRRKLPRIVIGGGRNKKMYFNKAQTKEIREYFEKEYKPKKYKELKNKDFMGRVKYEIYYENENKIKELEKELAKRNEQIAVLEFNNNCLVESIKLKDAAIEDLQRELESKKRRGLFGRLFGNDKKE